MKISPRELREAQIPSKAFGFNQDVVDALLERAADTIEGLIEENRQLFEALERLRSEGSAEATADPFAEVQPVAPPEPEPIAVEQPAPVAPASSIDENIAMAQINEKEELINKTLLLAQKTADETLKTANEQAKKLVEDSEKQAEELVTQARENAENLTGEAKLKAEKELAQAEEKATQLVEQAKLQAQELVDSAQKEADSIHAEEREKFVALVTQLKAERAQLLSDIEILQSFDEEHRTKLREIVEEDLEKLANREKLDIGAIPELPVIEDIEPVRSVENNVNIDEPEVVASSTEHAPEAPMSFDDAISVTPVVAPAGDEFEDEDEDDDDVIVGEIEADIVEEEHYNPDNDTKFDNGDPFAAFVDSPEVVAPAGEESPDSTTGVAFSSYGQVESTGSQAGFDPNATRKSPSQSELDDDDFFASLRDAVADDAPLGPSDDDEDEGKRSKGLFRK